MSANLKKSFSNLNEKLAKAFDGSGVRRNFTLPYVEGHNMQQHVQDVNATAAQSGGVLNNFLTSYHHTSGKGWGSADGETVGHPNHQLRNTIVTRGNKAVDEAIEAAQKHLNSLASVLGKGDDTILAAQHQLNLVKKTGAVGMNLFSLGTLLLQIMYRPTQAIARAHARVQRGGGLEKPGSSSAEPESAQSSQESPTGASGEPNQGQSTSEAGNPPAAAQAAPEASQAPPAEGGQNG